MIRVNLLRDRGSEGAAVVAESPVSPAKKQAIIKLVAFLLLPVSLYLYEKHLIGTKMNTLTRTRKQINTIKQNLQKFGDVTKVIKQHEQEKARLNAQLDVIKSLSRARDLSLKILDAIQTLIPDEVWLKNFVFAKGNIKFEGFSVTDEGVNSFVQALEESVVFDQVVPAKSERTSVNGQEVKKYVISCAVNGG